MPKTVEVIGYICADEEFQKAIKQWIEDERRDDMKKTSSFAKESCTLDDDVKAYLHSMSDEDFERMIEEISFQKPELATLFPKPTSVCVQNSGIRKIMRDLHGAEQELYSNKPEVSALYRRGYDDKEQAQSSSCLVKDKIQIQIFKSDSKDRVDDSENGGDGDGDDRVDDRVDDDYNSDVDDDVDNPIFRDNDRIGGVDDDYNPNDVDDVDNPIVEVDDRIGYRIDGGVDVGIGEVVDRVDDNYNQNEVDDPVFEVDDDYNPNNVDDSVEDPIVEVDNRIGYRIDGGVDDRIGEVDDNYNPNDDDDDDGVDDPVFEVGDDYNPNDVDDPVVEVDDRIGEVDDRVDGDYNPNNDDEVIRIDGAGDRVDGDYNPNDADFVNDPIVEVNDMIGYGIDRGVVRIGDVDDLVDGDYNPNVIDDPIVEDDIRVDGGDDDRGDAANYNPNNLIDNIVGNDHDIDNNNGNFPYMDNVFRLLLPFLLSGIPDEL